MEKWIRVLDRLPEIDEDVLVFGKMCSIDIGSWSGNGWYMLDGSSIAHVSHWMPLPDEPTTDNTSEKHD